MDSLIKHWQPLVVVVTVIGFVCWWWFTRTNIDGKIDGFDNYEDKPYENESPSNENESPSNEQFIPTSQFGGRKDGYVFKSGDEGIGYYLDQ